MMLAQRPYRLPLNWMQIDLSVDLHAGESPGQ